MFLARLPLVVLLLIVVLVKTANAVDVRRVGQKTSQSSDVALIFFHGLRSNPDDSFTNDSGRTWFQIIQSDTTSLPLGYSPSSLDVFVADWSDVFKSTANTEEAARLILDDRSFINVFKAYNHIILVGHSMGGIVIKRVLLAMRTNKKLLHRVIGVGLLAVPSNGAPLADIIARPGFWCRLDVFEWFCPDQLTWDLFASEWFGAKWIQISDLTTIESGNTFLAATEKAWADFYDERIRIQGLPFHISCAYEKDPMFPAIDIKTVPRLYATSTCSGSAHALLKDHSSIAKPIDQSDDSHDWLVRLLEQSLLGLERANQVQHPADLPLGATIDHVQSFHATPDPMTGIPMVDEELKIPSEEVLQQLRNLRLKRVTPTYSAATFEVVSHCWTVWRPG
jgi:pimeloyl-ACP methyl ester carboxylesterase